MRHPSRQHLLAYAENLVDRRSPVSAALAAHVAACPQCAAEVKAIRASLEFTANAPQLDPSRDLTRQILAAASQEQLEQRSARPASMTLMALRGGAYAAILALAAGFVFAVALQNPANSSHTPLRIAQPARESATPAQPSAEALRRTASEVRSLSAAVRVAAETGAQSPQDRQRLRALSALDADISAALSALERNPGCARASHIVYANLERQAKNLRALYLEQAL